MKLTDRLKLTARALADKATKPKTEAEIGVSGDFQAVYNREEARKDEVKIVDYRRMRENDGTVNALYNLLTLPIKAAEYTFEVDGFDAEKEGSTRPKELQLVEDNFTLPPHKGGMTLPFSLLIADMLRAVEDGFRAYEKVWTLNDQNKLVYRKIAPRDADSVVLLRDDHGGFAGIRQRSWNGTDYIDVTIPVERSFLYTFGKEKNFLYGESAFKSAYYHYDRKHKLYYLQQLAGQASAIPPRKLRVPESVKNNASKLAAAEAAADDFGVQQRITLPPGFDLEEYKTNPMDLQPAINHHDTLMARSTLMQFIVLAGSTTGSYSMSKDQSDLMMLALEGVLNQLEYHINTYLIPDLINYNFGTDVYPEIKFASISSETKDLMSAAFTELLKRQDLPGYVVEGIAEEVAKELGIDIEAAKAQAETAAKERAKNAPKVEPVKPGDQPKEADLSDKEDRRLSDGGFFRQLTDAEKRVNLADLGKRTLTAEERLQAEAETFYAGIKDDTVKRITSLLEKKDYGALKTFGLKSFTPYRKALESAMMEQYLYGKRTAADEVGGKIPQTPSTSRTYITQQARAVADKQEADLLFSVKAEVTRELQKQNLTETRDLSIADVLARIASVFLAFNNSIELGIAASLAGSLNLGRGDSFGASEDIDRMQYSAILDNRTTRMCKDLDNSVVSYEEYRATKWIPPCHFGCRSIWVAILKDDSFKPEFRAIPARPGGYSEPQL